MREEGSIEVKTYLNVHVKLKDDVLKKFQSEVNDVVRSLNRLFDSINELVVPENFDFTLTEE